MPVVDSRLFKVFRCLLVCLLFCDSSRAATRDASRNISTYRFDIAAGALDVVLAEFGQVTGATVAAPSWRHPLTASSPGVTGTYTADDALACI